MDDLEKSFSDFLDKKYAPKSKGIFSSESESTDNTEKQFSDFLDKKYAEPEPSTIIGEIPRGLKAGVQQLRGFGYGIGALAGEVTGSEGMKDWAKEGLADVEAKTPKPAVGSFADITNASDVGKYLSYGISTNLPNMLLSLAGGGAGGVAANMLAKGAGEALTKEAAKALTTKYITRGALTGAGLSSFGMEAGSIAGDQLTEGTTGKVDPLRAVAAAIPAALLDVIPEWYLAKRLGWLGDAAKVEGGRLMRGAKAFAGQFAMEAPTEAMQSVLERAAVPGKSITNKEAWDEYINSFILGGMTGGVVGGFGGILTKAQKDAETETPVTKALKFQPLANELEVAIATADPEGIVKTNITPVNLAPVMGGQAPGARGIGGQELQGPGMPPVVPAPITPAPITPAPTITPAAPAPIIQKPSAPVTGTKTAPVFSDKGYATESTALLAVKNRKASLNKYDITQKENGRWYVEPKAKSKPQIPAFGEKVDMEEEPAPVKITHFTRAENIDKILSEGFDTNLPPIHGLGGNARREAYTAADKVGKDVLYFTSDSDRWSKAQVYVGEGKGDKDYTYFDYTTQKWTTEPKAISTVNLSPVEAEVKKDAKTLTIDSMDKYLAFQKDNGIEAFPRDRMGDVVAKAKELGYDILNIKHTENWTRKDNRGNLKPNREGGNDWYQDVTGNGGKNDFFVLNKEAITLTKPPGRKQGKPKKVVVAKPEGAGTTVTRTKIKAARKPKPSISKNPMYPIAADIRKRGRLQLGAKDTPERPKHGFLANFDKATAKILMKMYPGILSKTGTLKLDEIAEEYGFKSDEDLLYALLNKDVGQSVKAGEFEDQDARWEKEFEAEYIKRFGTPAEEAAAMIEDEKAQAEENAKNLAEERELEEGENIEGDIEFVAPVDPILEAISSVPSGMLSKYEAQIVEHEGSAVTVPGPARIALENLLESELRENTGILGGKVSGGGNIGEAVYTVERPYGIIVYTESNGTLRAQISHQLDMAARATKVRQSGTMLNETLMKNITNNDTPGTIANETLQNSLDAIFDKDGLSKRDPSKREIKIEVKKGWLSDLHEVGDYIGTTTVTVTDNGKGMSEREVEKYLLTVGGKGKEGETSRGGFGLAKTSILFVPMKVKVITTKRGVTTILTGTREQFLGVKKAGTPMIDSQKVPMDTPSGTRLEMVFYNNYDDATKNNTYNLTFNDAEESFLKYIEEGINVPATTLIYENPTTGNYITKVTKEMKKLPQLHKPISETVEGNDFTVYFIPDPEPASADHYGKYKAHVDTFNDGLRLFGLHANNYSLLSSYEQLDWKVVVDFTKTTDVRDINYPFINNRTALLYQIARKVGDHVNVKIKEINDAKQGQNKKEFDEMIASSPIVNGVQVMIPFVDAEEFQKAKDLVEAPESRDMISAFTDIFKAFNVLIGKVGEKPVNLVLTVDPTVHGWRSRPDVTGHEFYAINPFAITRDIKLDKEFIELVKAGYEREEAMAGNMTYTLVHEYTHNFVGEHYESFVLAMAKIYMKMTHSQLTRLERPIRSFYETYDTRLTELQRDFESMGKGGTKFRQDSLAVSSTGELARGTEGGRGVQDVGKRGAGEGVKGTKQQSDMATNLRDIGRSDYSPGTTALLDLYDSYRANSKDVTHSPADIVASYEKATGLTFPYKWMVPLLDKLGTRISFDSSLIHRRDTAQAAYDPYLNLMIYGDRLNLVRDVKTMYLELFAHEGLHALVETEINKNTQLATELKSKLLKFAKELRLYLKTADDWVMEGMLKIQYVTPKELVNLAFTNPKFAKWLESIKVEGAVKPSDTLWAKLKSIILSVIGKMEGPVKTKLDELNEIMDTVLRIEIPKPPAATKTAFSEKTASLPGLSPEENFELTPKGEIGAKPEYRKPPPSQGQLFMDIGATMKRTMGTLESTFSRNPQNMPKALIKTIDNNFLRMTSGDLKGYDYALSIPFAMSQKYKEWKEAWRIHGIERAEKRGDLRTEHVKYADPYFTIDKRLKKEGLNKTQRKEAKARITRMIFATDAMLHDELVNLKEEARDAIGIRTKEIQDRIDEIISLRRYSDAQLTEGIVDEYGNTIKLNSPTEIAAYTSVRHSMDKMMDAKINWLHTMAFRKWSGQKWYNLLLQASGLDLTQESVQTLVGKQGLNSAAINYAKKIQVDIAGIFDRIEKKIAGASTDELFAVAERYDKLASKVQEELTKFKGYLGKITNIPDGKQLDDLTREVFAAYVQTRPYLKQIKGLRNQMNDWVGYAPRTREQGKFKIRLVETIFNDEGVPVGEKVIHSTMFNKKSEYAKLHMDLLSKYADKDGNLPENQSIVAENVTVSPEMAFQGVNDVNTQKIIDDAISNMKTRETYYDDKGNKIDIHDQLREAAFQSIANQFMTRGAAKSAIHRSTDLIKGYEEENLDRVLIGYISSMTGLMTKQLAAADFIDLMKGVTNKSMFEGLAKYNSEMLRNDSKGDKVSGRIRAAAFVWYLGGLLKSAAINLTQNPIVGFAELSKYMREHKIKGIGDVEYARAMKDVLSGKLNAIEKTLIEQLVSKGIAQDQYIQSIFEGMANKGDQTFLQVSRFLATPFSMSEIYNRKSAGVAIFRLAYPMYLSQGLSEEKAYDKAFTDTRTFIDNVHYAYGKTNRPLWMQSGDFSSQVMHTAYTFRGFTHNFLVRQATVLSQGDWRTFVKTMAYIGLLGGLMGLPFFKDFFEWVEKQFGYSPSKVVRKSLRGWGGKTLEEFGMTGLPSVLGANISGSLATGLPWPIGAETPEDTVFGVYGGLFTKAKRAKEAFGRGDSFRGMTEISPEVIRNPLVAARESQFGKDVFGTPGMATTTRGKLRYDEEGKPLQIKGVEVGLKAIGFNPTTSAREREMDQTIKRQESWASEAKANAGEAYRIARLNQEPDALRNMMMAVKDINQGIKSRGIEHLVPMATVAKILQSSREVKTQKQLKGQRYKGAEL